MIKPIKSLMNYNILNLKKVKKKDVLPIVMTPTIVYWSPKKNEAIRNGKLIEEAAKNKTYNSSHHPVKDATQKSLKELKEAGITNKQEQTRLLGKDGNLTQEGKNRIKNISHKGAPSEGIEENSLDKENGFNSFDMTTEEHLNSVYDLDPNCDDLDLDSVNLELEPELQEIANLEFPEDTMEFFDTVFDGLPDGMNEHPELFEASSRSEDLLDILEGIVDDIGECI